MSSKDVSRLLFQPRKHYAAARLQQGRSLLDSDYNEGAALDAEEWRRAVLDAVGPRGTPDEGFGIGQSLPPNDGPPVPDDALSPPTQTDPINVGTELTGPTGAVIGGLDIGLTAVSIRAGTFYLGGMRLELDRPEAIMFQRDFLQMSADDLDPGSSGQTALYYLEAWEQPVTAVEDEELLDRALGGPDTMVRMRRFRQVKLLGVPEDTSCPQAFDQLIDSLEADGRATFDCNTSELASNGRLQLVFQAGSDGDPCTPDPPAQYLGTENQALRIMLVDDSQFVWGFDNAAPIYRVNLPGLTTAPAGAATLDVELLTPAKDVEHQPSANRVIEFLPFAALLDGASLPPTDASRHFGKAAAEIGVFARVTQGIGTDGKTFQVEGSVLAELRQQITVWSSEHPFADRIDPQALTDPARPMYARFWHVAEGDTPVLIPTSDDARTAAPLADTGIIPVFHQPGRRGDFWVAALRPDTPQRIVPFDLLSDDAGVAPHGPRHFFAPLAVLRAQQFTGGTIPTDEGDEGTVFQLNTVQEFHDCRMRMRRLVDAGCTTFTVGDGLHTVGDFTSIQAAIDALPHDGGRVSILPGFYKQSFVIRRDGVTVEGCGDATVIESPTGSTADGVGAVADAAHATIANLRFHAVDQPGVFVRGTDVALTGLSIQAFVPDGDGVTPGGGTGSAGLIELHDTSHARLSGLLLESARRPAIRIESEAGAEDVTVSDSSALGSTDLALAPTPAAMPMIFVQGMKAVTVRRTSLQAFGQIGVQLNESPSSGTPTNTEMTLSELTILTGAHPALETQAAVDIDQCVGVVLEDSDITMGSPGSANAAVMVSGVELTVRGNSIVTETGGGSPAWGGIWLRGASRNVEIRNNDLRGGLGHGITVGGVLWGDVRRREPVGAAQLTAPDADGIRFVTGDLSGGLDDGATLPVAEGELVGIVIADNRIAEFQTNGISALTVLGLGATGDTDLLEIRSIRIEGNVISGNLLGPFADVRLRSDFLPFPAAAPPAGPATPLDLPVLPFGGIVLATVTDSAVIAGNTIEGNGTSPTLATSGIFVLNGEGIEIAQNKIARNGGLAAPDDAGTDNTPARGVRAGIAVMLAGNPGGTTGVIEDTLDIDPTTRPQASNSALALRVYQNSVQQPEGRALHAVATGPVAVDGNFLSSQGFHGASSAMDGFAIGDVVFVQDLGAPWEIVDANELFDGSDINNPFPGFTAPAGAPAVLVNNPTDSPRRFVGVGGAVLFVNNQIIYDWDVKRPVPTVEASFQPPLSYFAVAVLTLDHLCCVGNHFALRLGGVEGLTLNPPLTDPAPFPELEALLTEPLLANAFLGGSTVQVARNRFAENVLATTLSMISGAELMNMTSGNIGTHPMFAYQWWVGPNFEPPEFYMATNNVGMFVKNGVDFSNFKVLLRNQAKSFFQLLRQPT
ncbi:MAG TPA: DUF6519 domain-containing protein [Polyangia bacterium]|jgi:hypothetical protein